MSKQAVKKDILDEMTKEELAAAPLLNAKAKRAAVSALG